MESEFLNNFNFEAKSGVLNYATLGALPEGCMILETLSDMNGIREEPVKLFEGGSRSWIKYYEGDI